VLLSFTAIVLAAALLLFAEKNPIEVELAGARAWFRQGTDLKYKEFSTNKVTLFAAGQAIGTTKISGDGMFVLSASKTAVKVFDTETGKLVFDRSVTINGGGSGTAAEINWDGSKIYYCKGTKSRMVVYSMSIPDAAVKEIFVSRQGIAAQGEFCMSRDENRFVGRHSSDRAVYVDVKRNLEGVYDDECSPCISPDGTRCAVNQNGHEYMQIHQWPRDADKPRR
jgi:hypothetical protein